VDRLGSDDVRVVDCRYSFSDPDAGDAAFALSHVPGAVKVDLQRDLTGELSAHGGRHPLPDVDELAEVFGRLGIDGSVKVVAYDEDGSVAPRLWWMLRWLGHRQVAVLQGGWRGWAEGGGRLSTAASPPSPRRFVPGTALVATATGDEAAAAGRVGALVDSRPTALYDGAPNPVDRRAGHIPGARNLPWSSAFVAPGEWAPPEAQRRRLAAIAGAEDGVMYCGSGVTACVNLLALELIAAPAARLYVGSWSGWASHPDNPAEVEVSDVS
jgi:thiosulfate/3-mercaptopyruvate sulfurtransferase